MKQQIRQERKKGQCPSFIHKHLYKAKIRAHSHHVGHCIRISGQQMTVGNEAMSDGRMVVSDNCAGKRCDGNLLITGQVFEQALKRWAAAD